MSYDVSLKCKHCNSYLFESSHTSNTNEMWLEHNFDFTDWNNKLASKMLIALQPVLDFMLEKGTGHYKHYNPENCWGGYESTLNWFVRIQQACIEYPDALVEV